MNKIRSAEDFINDFYAYGESDGWETRWDCSSIIQMINKSRLELIEYISNNIDADYEIISNNEMFKADVNGCIEVFVKKGEFDKFKSMIK